MPNKVVPCTEISSRISLWSFSYFKKSEAPFCRTSDNFLLFEGTLSFNGFNPLIIWCCKVFIAVSLLERCKCHSNKSLVLLLSSNLLLSMAILKKRRLSLHKERKKQIRKVKRIIWFQHWVSTEFTDQRNLPTSCVTRANKVSYCGIEYIFFIDRPMYVNSQLNRNWCIWFYYKTQQTRNQQNLFYILWIYL